FFQAEDGIRDFHVTGVQTCALPISAQVGFVPRPGDQVEVRARVSLYEPRGDYQLQADGMRRAGVGNLYEAFLRLKAQLQDEGLRSEERRVGKERGARGSRYEYTDEK